MEEKEKSPSPLLPGRVRPLPHLKCECQHCEKKEKEAKENLYGSTGSLEEENTLSQLKVPIALRGAHSVSFPMPYDTV